MGSKKSWKAHLTHVKLLVSQIKQMQIIIWAKSDHHFNPLKWLVLACQNCSILWASFQTTKTYSPFQAFSTLSKPSHPTRLSNFKIKPCVSDNLSLYTLLLSHLTCSWCWDRSCTRWLFCCCWSLCFSELCSSTSLSCRALSSCCCSSCSSFSSRSKLCSSWAFSPCRCSHRWTLTTTEIEKVKGHT